MNHLQDVLKQIEIELRGDNKLSTDTWNKLSELSEWDFKICSGFITEVNLRIKQGAMDFVFKKYNVEQPYKNKIKKDLVIAMLKRDQRDTVLTDVLNRLVIPQKLTWESMEIWGMPVEQARNIASKKALEFGCKYLLFIDDDIVAENTALVKLFETMNITNKMVVAADYQKKADFEITAHGNFYDTETDYIKETDLCAMGFTLMNIDEITKKVPFPLFWTFPAPDGYWSMGEDAFFTKNFIEYVNEKPIIDLRPSILHYDKTWKKCFGKRDKNVTYATQMINDFDQFERLRVAPEYPIINICIPRRTENDPIATNFNSLLNLRGYRNEFSYSAGLYIDEARNQLATNAVKIGSEFLLFVDNDIILPENGLVKMLEIMEDDIDKEIGVVSGDYLLKGKIPHSAFLQLDDRGIVTELNRIKNLPKIVESNWLIGLGCCLIRTEVFRQLRYPWFVCYSVDEKMKGVSDTDQGGVNEDAHFCELMFENGYKIKIINDLKCVHVDFEKKKMYGYDNQFDMDKYACYEWINKIEYISIDDYKE